MYEKANIDFFGKIKNNTKNVWVEGSCVACCARKREIASKGRFEMIKVNKLIFTIAVEIQKNVIDTYMKLQTPMLWRHFFKNIATNRDCVYIFCNRPLNEIDRYCREWCLYNLVKNNTDGGEDNIQMLDELDNFALYF